MQQKMDPREEKGSYQETSSRSPMDALGVNATGRSALTDTGRFVGIPDVREVESLLKRLFKQRY
jgi:hypothetical protein